MRQELQCRILLETQAIGTNLGGRGLESRDSGDSFPGLRSLCLSVTVGPRPREPEKAETGQFRSATILTSTVPLRIHPYVRLHIGGFLPFILTTLIARAHHGVWDYRLSLCIHIVAVGGFNQKQ